MNRRSLIEGSAIGLTGLAVANRLWPHRSLPRRSSKSVVAILRCSSYDSCHHVVDDGLRLLAPDVRGKRVLLKPNLVEYSSMAPINTHPRVVAATADSLYRLGAAEVIVADGPGHVRDSELLIEESGMKDQLAAIGRTRFIDLNFDAVRRVTPRVAFTTLTELWLPETVLKADIMISMPKIKTHHWAGVTLSLKNLFGCVPGNVYGWPKNILHWQGIDNSIAELAATIPVHYVIEDGIEAMEGNGPLHGTTRSLGCLIFSDDPIAADATACRVMGIQPTRVRHLRIASALGSLLERDIIQRGDSVSDVRKPIGVLPEFRYLLE